jgi:uncharacterized RDD family membrane protein YckC
MYEDRRPAVRNRMLPTMSHVPPVTRSPVIDAAPNVSGVLGSRIAAFCVDFIVIGILWLVFFVALMLLGLVTFGLSWLLIAPLFPVVAVLYNALTISGPRRSTWGMRIFGVEIRTMSGQTPPFVVAAVHALFFYVTVSALTPLILLVGLLRDDSRLVHDLLAGLIAVRAGS